MNGTPPFLAKRVRAALEEVSALLPYLFAFQVGSGWGNKRDCIMPIVARVSTERRPPMVWLLGPLPLSASARFGVGEWFAYLFSLGYSVRWTSCCSFCDVGINEKDAPHRCVFSMLALLDDGQVHCAEKVTMKETPVFVEYNAEHAIVRCERTAVGERASVMHKNAISVLQLRVIFKRLLSRRGQYINAGLSCYALFFEEEFFLNVVDNDLKALLAGDGYGCRGEFGLVQVRRLCRENDVLADSTLSVQYLNWITSFCENSQGK